ncbi:hypothetical protein J6590_077006 [Homalodisca vitripennis]|nr:hypothetical protein J6590_077006 [Homalodisca vitripennis]
MNPASRQTEALLPPRPAMHNYRWSRCGDSVRCWLAYIGPTPGPPECTVVGMLEYLAGTNSHDGATVLVTLDQLSFQPTATTDKARQLRRRQYGYGNEPLSGLATRKRKLFSPVTSRIYGGAVTPAAGMNLDRDSSLCSGNVRQGSVPPQQLSARTITKVHRQPAG